MQQDTAARPEPNTRIHGRYEITAQVTVDGAYSITTMTATGGNREHALCLTTADRDTYRLAYAVIREGGINNVHPDGVKAALNTALRNELFRVQERHDGESRTRIEHINALLDRLESPADTTAIEVLVEQVRRNLTDTVPAGRQPQITRSRTGVEHKPLSVPMQRALNTHTNGIVYPDARNSRATLRALAGRGLGILHFEGRRKRIVSLELNKHGLAAVTAVA